jgi:hypothetical protein
MASLWGNRLLTPAFLLGEGRCEGPKQQKEEGGVMRQVVIKWYERTYSAPDEDEEYNDEGANTDEGEAVIDDLYIDEGKTFAEEVAAYLRGEGATEASSYPSWSKGAWYTRRDSDMYTGETTETSYHIQEGLTDDEQREVYRLVTK